MTYHSRDGIFTSADIDVARIRFPRGCPAWFVTWPKSVPRILEEVVMVTPKLFLLRENRTPPAMPAGPFTAFRGTPICGPTRYFDRARKVKCNQLPGQDKVRSLSPPPPPSFIPLIALLRAVSGNASLQPRSICLSRHALTAFVAIALSIQELSLHVSLTPILTPM